MQIKNPEVYSLIESIGLHFNTNISNRFTRASLSLLPLDTTTWTQLEELTEKAANYRYQGYHLDELYAMILSMARFVSAARKQGTQYFKMTAGTTSKLTTQDKILHEMVINNFSSNLNILADSTNKLYIKVVELDKIAANGKPAIYTKHPDLAQLGRYLVG